MYLRTPKRYRPGRRRNLRLFSWRTVFMLLLIPGLALLGWLIWENQDAVRSTVQSEADRIMQVAQTQVAPAPTPTTTPDLAMAQSGCEGAYRAGDLEEAIEQCMILAESNPNDVQLHYRITHMLIITSNFGRDEERIQQAVEFAERTINANPEAPHGWAIRAMALDWAGDYGGALASALHAKALDDQFAPAYAFLGEIYQDLGQYETAWGFLEQANTLDTGGIAVADTFRNQGLWYSNQGYWEDAIQPYQAALQNAPSHTYIAVELANNYIALNEITKAIEVLRGALERNPSDTSVLFALGSAYYRNGEFDRSYEYYRRCLDVDSENIPCLSYLGGLQWSDGDFVTASTNLERAIELGSEDPVDYYQLGHSQMSLGRCDRALPYLQQGYQMVLEDGPEAYVERFVSALRSCGQVPEGAADAAGADGAAETGAAEDAAVQ